MKLELEVLQSLFSRYKFDRKKENLIVPCPKCGQMEFAIAINRDSHPNTCSRKNKCGWGGNIYTLLQELGRTDLINSEKDYTGVISRHRLVNKIEETQEKPIQTSIPTISPPIGWRRINSHSYLLKRHFTEFDRYEVGTTKLDPKLKDNYIIFLIRQFGEIKGYIGRHLFDKKDIENNNRIYKETGKGKFILRYYNSITDFSQLLFGYDEITLNTSTVILVEGIFDKFRVDKLLDLYSNENIKCVCSFKCHLSDEQKSLLKQKGVQNLILLYDSDVIRDIQKTINDILYEFNNIQIGFHPDSSIDPGDYNYDDIELVLSTLKSPASFMSSKLAVKKLE